jgi:hypothetical protein
MERFNLKKLYDEVKKLYLVEISNRFAALENLDDDDEDVDINRAGKFNRK